MNYCRSNRSLRAQDLEYWTGLLCIEPTAVCRKNNALMAAGESSDRITSEVQWRTFANSLASEGLVAELTEQQQLQKIWDRAVLGANSFGRKCVPPLLDSISSRPCQGYNIG